MKIKLEFHSRAVKAMSHRMRRREFLAESSRAAFGFSLLSFPARAQGNQISAESKDARWGTLIADLEKQIPKLMEKAIVPGLSIAIIKDAKLTTRSLLSKSSIQKGAMRFDSRRTVLTKWSVRR